MALVAALVVSAMGCAIADRSDKFGAELDLGLGGIVSSMIDIRLYASVGFSKTCKDGVNGEKEADLGDDPLGLRGCL